LRRVVANDTELSKRLLGVVLNKVDMRSLPNYLDDSSVESHYDQYSDYLSPTLR